MKVLFEQLTRAAKTESHILIRGETGTGKELVAKAIHDLSPRRRNPFHAFNCATLTPELAASELFGHEKGSFTGAIATRKGLFEVANSGTLFMDEIAEVPNQIQAGLLRILQEKTFTRVGSTKVLHTDVRILSATHKALREEVKLGRFREDLMYRIRVVPLYIPGLVDRQEDLEHLTMHFIAQYNKLGGRHIEKVDTKAKKLMGDYHWPGNIRELKNNIEYAFAIGSGSVLTVEDLTPELRGILPRQTKLKPTTNRDEHEKILRALEQSNGNKGEAAKLLNMDRSTLWRKAKTLGIF